MVKKYLIRIVGALCILGAIALMLMPAWLILDDIGHRELRNLRSDIDDLCSNTEELVLERITWDEDFKDELRDYDLPYSRGSIKGKFQDIKALTDELLNDTVSIQEVLTLCIQMPGLVSDAENLLDSDCGDEFFYTAAGYILEQEEPYYEFDREEKSDAAEQLQEMMEDDFDVILELSDICISVAIAIIFLFALGVASAATHICNKVRWLKYPFLGIVVGMVAGSCAVLPLASEVFIDVFGGMPAYADVTLKMGIAPFGAVALMIVPIILDIIFERKKERKVVEE